MAWFHEREQSHGPLFVSAAVLICASAAFYFAFVFFLTALLSAIR
jgi:hypothetical protein